MFVFSLLFVLFIVNNYSSQSIFTMSVLTDKLLLIQFAGTFDCNVVIVPALAGSVLTDPLIDTFKVS